MSECRGLFIKRTKSNKFLHQIFRNNFDRELVLSCCLILYIFRLNNEINYIAYIYFLLYISINNIYWPQQAAIKILLRIPAIINESSLRSLRESHMHFRNAKDYTKHEPFSLSALLTSLIVVATVFQAIKGMNMHGNFWTFLLIRISYFLAAVSTIS